MKVVGIIPARYGSTRFPGKPLVELCGKPMIRWVHENVVRCRTVDSAIVATDDERIRACVEAFGGRVVMTSSTHVSGTDRVAEAASGLDADVVVNVQGDEPLLASELIDRTVEALLEDPRADAATLVAPLTDADAFHDPNVVKAVATDDGLALWFSRAPIPWPRDAASETVRPDPPAGCLRHVGLYAYRTAFLSTFVGHPPTRVERIEGLEQLRALAHGARIRIAHADRVTPSIDVPDDVSTVEARLRDNSTAELS